MEAKQCLLRLKGASLLNANGRLDDVLCRQCLSQFT